jgi:hypothetical protein
MTADCRGCEAEALVRLLAVRDLVKSPPDVCLHSIGIHGRTPRFPPGSSATFVGCSGDEAHRTPASMRPMSRLPATGIPVTPLPQRWACRTYVCRTR